MELCDATEDNPFVHGMSRTFVAALHQLFTVLDANQTGTIRYLDLAHMWEEDSTDPFLPKGLMSCLARVTMVNGLLTFDRFCAGIKLCLLKNQVEANGEDLEKFEKENQVVVGSEPLRPPSEPQMLAPPPPPPASLPPEYSNEDNNNNSLTNSTLSTMNSTFVNLIATNSAEENVVTSSGKKLPLPSYEQVMANKNAITNSPASSTSAGDKLGNPSRLQVKPTMSTNVNNERPVVLSSSLYENFATTLSKDKYVLPPSEHCRTKSMSNLDHFTCPQSMHHNNNLQSNPELTTLSKEDCKPSIGVTNSSCKHQAPPPTPRTLSRNCIMKTLQNWRDQIMHNGKEIPVTNGTMVVKGNLKVLDLPSELDVASLRRNAPRRREPRRHTVGADGIDLYTVRRFQQLQQEKEILHRGLVQLDKTREWYLRQLSTIQEKLIHVGQSGMFPNDGNIDAQQERINLQSARIQYMNEHLIGLRESAFNYPLHMNLAIRAVPKADPNQPKQLVVNPNLVNKLKEQNRLLTDEVCQKSDRITQLEREKSALIRELFQARTYSSYYNGDFDDTLM